jgi:ribonucleoside-diphosphate reductase alpha chain
MTAYKQGQTRKGSYAAYMDISHPDIIEFLNIRIPTGGDSNRKCFNLNNAINITDSFVNAVISNSKWDLVDPHDNSVRDTVDAREMWERILETRFRTGEPYLNFIDEANRHLPKELKESGLEIKGSNLCNEIHLPTDENRTAVCCLSSVNLERFEEWKTSSLVCDLITMLDNVLTCFIEDAHPIHMAKSIRSAIGERSLGLGAMGFHSYLQSKNIPWESALAVGRNRQMFNLIKEQAVEATKALADVRGPYQLGIGSGRRNSHLLAVAPNANSGMILGTSPSIEPIKSNSFVHKTRIGSHLIKNKYLEATMEEHRLRLGKDEEWLEKEWRGIGHHNGSVQHIDYLSEWEKDVFKTAFELDQSWVVQHAADRQEFICQGQSVNLFFPAGSDKNYVSQVHLQAWKQKLKGLYYLRTSATSSAENIGKQVTRVALKDFMEDTECLACQG